MVKKYKAEKVVVKEVPFSYGSGYDIVKKEPPKVKDYGPQPDGQDHGSATKMLISYMDEVLTRTRLTDTKQVIPQKPPQKMSKSFNDSSFLEKVKHVQMKDMPLASQKAAQVAIWPVHSTDKKKRVGDIASRLRRNDGSLVRCRLNSEGMDDQMLEIVSRALPKNIFLQHLMLHDNAITDVGVEKMCLALRWHPSVHTIWLGGNQVGDATAQHISTLLDRNHNITDVNISNKWPRKTWTELEQIMHPHISNVGAECLARQLMRCCGLTSLNLNDQRVRDSGAAYIFKALVPSRLRALNLGKNELTDKCCVPLHEALCANPNLEKLVLSGNKIGDQGCTYIAKALTRNGVLQALDVSDCAVKQPGLQALVDCLQYNHTLSSITTVGNPGSTSDSRAEDIVRMRMEAGVQVSAHEERTTDTGYKLGYTAIVGDDHIGYGQTGLAPPTPNTQTRLDDIANLGRGSTPLPVSLAMQTPPGSRQAGSRGGGRVTPPGSAGLGRPGSRGDLGSRGARRRDADSPLAVAGVGTSGLRPRTRELRMGTIERTFRHEGEDVEAYNATMSEAESLHFAESWPAGFKHSDPEEQSVAPTTPGSRSIAASWIDDSGTGDPGAVPKGVSQGRLADKPNAFGPYKPFAPYGHREGEVETPIKPLGSPGSPGSGVGTGKSAAEYQSRLGSNLEDSSMEGFKGMFADGGSVTGPPAHGAAGPMSPSHAPRTTSRAGGSRDGAQSRGGLMSPITPGGSPPPRGLTSRELGKTTRIPKTGSSGIRPIRVTGRHRDSGPGGHLLYLRVSTPEDGDGVRPYSLLDIARDHEKALADERAYRQTEEYKMHKEELFREIEIKGPLNASKGALRPAPPSFWETWRKKNHDRYPKGIDNATGCSSTAVDARALASGGYDTTFLAMVRQEKELGIKNYREPPSKVTTPAEAFVMRRREARVRRTIAERAASNAGQLMEDFGMIAGLKVNESLGKGLTNKTGLTHQISANERQPDFQARKVVVH